MPTRSIFVLAGLWLAGFACTTAHAAQYSVIDLGTLGGNSSTGFGINDNCIIVGQSTTAAGNTHPFWSDGRNIYDLGTFGGSTGEAYGVNNSNEIVGNAYDSAGNDWAFVAQTGGSLTNLGALGGVASWAYAINASGQIVGNDMNANYQNSGFLYCGGTMSSLGSLGANANNGQGLAINDNGAIAGEVNTSSGYEHAYVDNGGILKDLGTLGGSSSVPNGINNAGLVVGQASTASGANHAFACNTASGGALVDLGGFSDSTSSTATGVNNYNQIVGEAPSSSLNHPFLCNYNSGGLQDLNTLIPSGSGWNLYQANAINNQGYITGVGIHNGPYHAFLLVPIAPSGVLYDFENSVNGWTGSNLAGGPWSVTEWHATGSYSLKADVNLTSGGVYYLSNSIPKNFSGKTRLTCVARRATWGTYTGGLTAKLYIQTGSNWTWYDSGPVAVDANGETLTVNLSDVANLDSVQAVGVQFTAGSGDSGQSAVYVDDVTLQ